MDRIILVIILGLLMMGCCSKPKTPASMVANAVIPYANYPGDYTNNPMDEDAPHSIMPVTLDGAFSKADTDEVMKGLAGLNKAFNGYIFIVVVDKSLFSSGTVDFILADLPSNENGSMLGVTDKIGGNIIKLDMVKMHLLDVSIAQVTQHEFFHHLGADHVQIQNTLMYKSVEHQPNCVDFLAAKQLATIYSKTMKLNNLNWCSTDP